MKPKFTSIIYLIVIILSATFCAKAQLSVNVTYTHASTCDTCFIFNAQVSGGTPPYSYYWDLPQGVYSTGSSATYCFARDSYWYNYSYDEIILTVTDANSQVTDSLGTLLSLLPWFSNTTSVPTCLVTVDSATGKNLIVWEPGSDSSVVAYLVQKETTTSNVYSQIGAVPKGSFSTFLDTNSNPSQSSSFYRVITIDSCGFLGVSNMKVNSLHLQISAGIQSTWNLNWNTIQSNNPVVKFRIWRASNMGQFALIDSVSSSVNAYTDQNAPGGILHYLLEARSSGTCNPSAKTMQSYSSSLSNITNNSSLIGIDEAHASHLNIMPNPCRGHFSVSATSANEIMQITVLDLSGNEVKKATGKDGFVDVSDISNGVYFVRVKTVEGVFNQKIIVQQ